MTEKGRTGRFWKVELIAAIELSALFASALLLSTGVAPLATAQDRERPSSAGHVPELAAYLDHVQISEPVSYRHLAVYPILLREGIRLEGRWLSLDAAVSRGVLVVSEKGAGGSVPLVVVENRSREEHVFIMTGEVISGGKQTRTVRNDVVLSPGQRIELNVFCVEAHRWEGGEKFAATGALVPQSIQQELRKGADQGGIWSEVARNNKALGAENPSGSLDLALKARPVQDKLAEVRRSIVPNIPQGSMGFLFVDGGRALGAEFFGDAALARALLPKLLDSYAVDCVLIPKGAPEALRQSDDRVAIEFFKRVVRTGSQRSTTPGSGAGIRTRSGGLLGDGVGMGGTVVHYGVQVQDRIVPHPVPIDRPRPLEERRSRPR
jgi:hypothetical protein